ncbi:hypothetical protein M5K25_021965 [Dendrobium thyrsiflorum]|uniref:Uncharacterized protein n=1 Tax=Dendrobium thyrsiflorum TaxID=117978 RepID=A0ABD0U5V8_DENTH
MGYPDVDHGFLYDDQGRTNMLESPFFDVHFGNDETANEYIDRILYQLTLSVEEHIPPGRWYLVSRSPTSSDLATAPTTTSRGFYLPLVASLETLPSSSLPTRHLLHDLGRISPSNFSQNSSQVADFCLLAHWLAAPSPNPDIAANWSSPILSPLDHKLAPLADHPFGAPPTQISYKNSPLTKGFNTDGERTLRTTIAAMNCVLPQSRREWSDYSLKIVVHPLANCLVHVRGTCNIRESIGSCRSHCRALKVSI